MSILDDMFGRKRPTIDEEMIRELLFRLAESWSDPRAARDSSRAALSQSGEPGIPSDMLMKLIRLCHPDKHDNSPLSTEVTRWLLTQRASE